jgi:hypothetical protein
MHDSPQTEAILARGLVPGAYWMNDRPIVLPCTGGLAIRDAAPGAIFAHEDERLGDVPDEPTKLIAPIYDLTNSYFSGL